MSAGPQTVASFGPTGWAEWDSVHFLLGSRLMGHKCAGFVDARRQSVNWTGLRRASRSWSHAERLVVALAQNLWNGTGKPSIREMVDTLDSENFALALQAVRIARGRRGGVGVLEESGGEP